MYERQQSNEGNQSTCLYLCRYVCLNRSTFLFLRTRHNVSLLTHQCQSASKYFSLWTRIYDSIHPFVSFHPSTCVSLSAPTQVSTGRHLFLLLSFSLSLSFSHAHTHSHYLFLTLALSHTFSHSLPSPSSREHVSPPVDKSL